MIRVIAVLACGFGLAACSMSMPSLDFLKSSPATQTLRVESEPPGADARTTQGQSCRTPCELSVESAGELAVTFALNGYQPVTVPVQMEATPGAGYGEATPSRLQPNPVYAELQPVTPARPQKKKSAPAKKKTVQSAAPQAEPAAVPDVTTAASPGSPWPQTAR